MNNFINEIQLALTQKKKTFSLKVFIPRTLRIKINAFIKCTRDHSKVSELAHALIGVFEYLFPETQASKYIIERMIWLKKNPGSEQTEVNILYSYYIDTETETLPNNTLSLIWKKSKSKSNKYPDFKNVGKLFQQIEKDNILKDINLDYYERYTSKFIKTHISFEKASGFEIYSGYNIGSLTIRYWWTAGNNPCDCFRSFCGCVTCNVNGVGIIKPCDKEDLYDEEGGDIWDIHLSSCTKNINTLLKKKTEQGDAIRQNKEFY